MLQISDRRAVGAPVLEDLSSSALLKSFFGFVRRQFAVVLFVCLAALALGAIYLVTTPARYTAHALLMIDTGKVQPFRQSMLADVPIDASAVESQVEILKAENVALAVVKKLHLAEDPGFLNSGGGLIGAVLNFLPRIFGSEESRSQTELTRRALQTLQSMVVVKRLGLTYVVNIAVTSLNPDRAAEIANAVAEAYIADQLDAKYETTRRAAIWLQERLQELRGQASVAEHAVVDFKTNNNIVDTGGRLMSQQQLAELSTALVQARAQTTEAKARLDRVTKILREDDPNLANSNTATVTDSLQNAVITKLRQEYVDLSNREADWSRRYGKTHLATVNLGNQMVEIRRSIKEELRRIAETYKSDFEIAKSRQESVEQSLNSVVSESQSTNQAQIKLRELESTSQSYRSLYDNFLQRHMESVQQESFPITEARLITRASPPANRSSPKALLVFALTGSAGLLLGFGAGMLREMSDRAFRTSKQVENVLQVSCVSVVPIVKSRGIPAKPDETPADSRTIERRQSITWQIVDAPLSRFAEAIRSIRVAVQLSRRSKPNQVIGITSTVPNEGKSTIAAAFAQLLAQSGARVLLVDLDLRRPALTREITPRARIGVLEVMTGAVSANEAVWVERETNLKFLPAVVQRSLPNSSEVLDSVAIKNLFVELRRNYDHIIVDLPPLVPVVDVRATSEWVDSYLFVIEWGRTYSDEVKQVLASAQQIYEKLIGVVLNKADIKLLSKYNSLNYYDDQRYSRYGYTD